ncbi:hypothetical protein ADUPG1_013361, partial [Aduncisulcus paluster]
SPHSPSPGMDGAGMGGMDQSSAHIPLPTIPLPLPTTSSSGSTAGLIMPLNAVVQGGYSLSDTDSDRVGKEKMPISTPSEHSSMLCSSPEELLQADKDQILRSLTFRIRDSCVVDVTAFSFSSEQKMLLQYHTIINVFNLTMHSLHLAGVIDANFVSSSDTFNKVVKKIQKLVHKLIVEEGDDEVSGMLPSTFPSNVSSTSSSFQTTSSSKASKASTQPSKIPSQNRTFLLFVHWYKELTTLLSRSVSNLNKLMAQKLKDELLSPETHHASVVDSGSSSRPSSSSLTFPSASQGSTLSIPSLPTLPIPLPELYMPDESQAGMHSSVSHSLIATKSKKETLAKYFSSEISTSMSLPIPSSIPPLLSSVSGSHSPFHSVSARSSTTGSSSGSSGNHVVNPLQTSESISSSLTILQYILIVVCPVLHKRLSELKKLGGILTLSASSAKWQLFPSKAIISHLAEVLSAINLSPDPQSKGCCSLVANGMLVLPAGRGMVSPEFSISDLPKEIISLAKTKQNSHLGAHRFVLNLCGCKECVVDDEEEELDEKDEEEEEELGEERDRDILPLASTSSPRSFRDRLKEEEDSGTDSSIHSAVTRTKSQKDKKKHQHKDAPLLRSISSQFLEELQLMSCSVFMPLIFLDVIRDLVLNSRKYTQAPSTIRVNLFNDIMLHELVFEVSDAGIGMDVSHMSDYIKAGRGREHNRRGMGMGLGLTKVAFVVKLLEGKMQVSSKHGAGTRVRITIPYPSVTKELLRKRRESESSGKDLGAGRREKKRSIERVF